MYKTTCLPKKGHHLSWEADMPGILGAERRGEVSAGQDGAGLSDVQEWMSWAQQPREPRFETLFRLNTASLSH